MSGSGLRRFKRWRLVLVLATAVFLALVGLEAFRYVRAYTDLATAKDLLVDAAALMEEEGLDITHQDLVDVEEQLVEGRGKLGGAAGVLRNDPVLAVARHLPWLGTQIDAARNLTNIGSDLSDIGIEAVEALKDFQRIRDTRGGAFSEKVVPVLEAVEPHVAVIEEKLAAVRESRSRIADDGLLSVLSSAVSQMDRHVEELERLLKDERRAARIAPEVLGYNEPQTYLVLAHDNTEMLGSGGFILVYGFLTFDRGELERIFFDDVGGINPDWPPTTNGYIAPPRPLDTYLLRGWPMGLAEAAWWPDFPTVARNAIEIYRTNSGIDASIDGVIGVNFFTLEKLLEVIGPIRVEEYGETVTSENVTEKTLIMTHPEGVRPWETDRYDFVGYLARDVINKALTVGPSRWASLVSALRTLGREKNLLLYHTDPTVQGIISEMSWDGRVRPARGDYLMVVDSSLRSSKLNLVVQPRIDLEVRLDSQGNASNVVTITYTNPFSSWAREKDPRLVRAVTWGEELVLYGNYLRLLTPFGSRLKAVVEDERVVGPEDLWIENGRSVFARYFALPLDATKQIVFKYIAPRVADVSSSPYVYRLLVQKQPGTRAIPLTVTFYPPPGLEIVSIELDGEELAGETSQIVTDLRQDREIVVRYRRRH